MILPEKYMFMCWRQARWLGLWSPLDLSIDLHDCKISLVASASQYTQFYGNFLLVTHNKPLLDSSCTLNTGILFENGDFPLRDKITGGYPIIMKFTFYISDKKQITYILTQNGISIV